MINFFFDSFYLHSKPAKDNSVEEICNFMSEIDKGKKGFFYEHSSTSKKLYSNFASLIAHPLQRGEQSKYTLLSIK